MRSLREILTFETENIIEFIEITDQVRSCVQRARIKEGLCLVGSRHCTASVFVTTEEMEDLDKYRIWLEDISPKGAMAHLITGRTGYETSDAHFKSYLMGRESTFAISQGELDIEPYSRIIYGEFDGMREKRVIVKVLGY